MASKKEPVEGTYTKSVPDGGDAPMGGSKQSSAKFGGGFHKPTDNLPKPSHKGNGVKTISENRSNP